MIGLGNRHCASCIGALSFPMSEFYSYRRVFVTFYTRACVLTKQLFGGADATAGRAAQYREQFSRMEWTMRAGGRAGARAGVATRS